MAVTIKGLREAETLIQKRMKALVEEVVVDAFDRLVSKTPVVSGRLAANWRVGIHRIDDTYDFDLRAQDIDSAKALARSRAATADPGDTVFITNVSPYAWAAEVGYKHHKANQMVTFTGSELRQRVPELVRKVAKLK